MRPPTTLLFTMSRGWQRMLRIQDPIDLGRGRGQSRQAARPVSTRCEIRAGPQEPTSKPATSILVDVEIS